MWRESLCRRGQMQSSFLYLRSFLCAAEAEKMALRGALAQHCYSAVDRRNNEGLNVVLQLFLEHSAQHSLTADQVSAFICSARRPNHKHGTGQGRDVPRALCVSPRVSSEPAGDEMALCRTFDLSSCLGK